MGGRGIEEGLSRQVLPVYKFINMVLWNYCICYNKDLKLPY